MRIRPTQVFLDGHKRYREGRTYEVEDALGLYFCRNGWAVDLDAPAADLAIQDGHIGVESEVETPEG